MVTSARFGTVYFVEAGPDDPGLWTVRSRELLARADVVVCDRGLRPDALGLSDAGGVVEEVSAGEDPAARARRVEAWARRSAVVIRLWAPDTLLSGRGVEEALAVSVAGIPFEIVPAIPRGLAAAAYAGIPLAREGIAWAIVLASVPEPETSGGPYWEMCARAGATLVCTTRSARLGALSEALTAHGWPGDTPAVAIRREAGAQHTWMGTLRELAGRAGAAADAEPAVLVAGGAAALGPALRWLERRPLFGRRIVVTRSRAQAPELVAALSELGAQPIEFPTLRVVDPPDPERLRQAARSVDTYDWVLFTSVNGVERFWTALGQCGRDARAFAGTRLAAIGPGTAAALAARGLQADLVPEKYVAEGILEALAGLGPWAGRRVLLPRAAGARDVLPQGIAGWGAQVDEVPAYTTEPDRGDVDGLRGELRGGHVDAITFTASSTVRNFVEAIGAEIDGAAVAVIGPVTARTARELGLPVQIEAASHTIRGLVDALCEHFRPAAP